MSRNTEESHIFKYIFQTHRFIHVEEDGRSVYQDIIHDAVENTVMVIVGDLSMFENYIPTVNLHDFNTVRFLKVLLRIFVVENFSIFPARTPSIILH